jgi:hypothetical protein
MVVDDSTQSIRVPVVVVDAVAPCPSCTTQSIGVPLVVGWFRRPSRWVHTDLVQILTVAAWRCITWGVLLIEYLLGGLTLVAVMGPFPPARVVHCVGLAGSALQVVLTLTVDLGFSMAFLLGWVPFRYTHRSGRVCRCQRTKIVRMVERSELQW